MISRTSGNVKGPLNQLFSTLDPPNRSIYFKKHSFCDNLDVCLSILNQWMVDSIFQRSNDCNFYDFKIVYFSTLILGLHNPPSLSKLPQQPVNNWFDFLATLFKHNTRNPKVQAFPGNIFEHPRDHSDKLRDHPGRVQGVGVGMLMVLWFYGFWFCELLVLGFMVLWFYGCMVCWFYGFMVSWFHSCMVSWFCGFVVLWFYGFIVLWFYDFMVLWFYGCMVSWFYGFMVLWFYGFIVLWLYSLMVSWLCGFIVLWLYLYGCMVLGSYGFIVS